MKFYCIADEDTVRGFRLAGVEGRVVTSASEAAEALDATVADPEHGVVILTQQVAASMRKQVDAFRLERDRPLLVEIPGRDGPLAGRKTLRHLVHAAVGVRLDKREGT
ncbi:MAG: V-type ATP synthase subunit F [Verrucomicrobia bacterium]|nr:V-type ATP synthase subunit F [Verrucomicrobiota bacterium]OQC68094.1 MAG: V-type ATP synthase subunit F [Verrucomicrobia bacterium ADurb.Bin006]MDI9379478.1 V-type ATP synthase subunit F [Verrucomicrobiota bacterium]NMD18880.1 Vacuolar H+transporting two-sector ATPase F subunit [Verrucomicrobiota bacterium]HOA62589.1 V-type ATP synthase subunit F [Verrucomicrobiota bacterium]